ncbi:MULTISPECIES: hypothetical protein [unclassified Frankia]|uniref:hypothetical protein n=1 Tax=unclassified Frankia TaxID=2632575 RepID=UPI002AD4E473|nr:MULTISPECIES: hypothetical protein [unclassified Frankia]
MTSATTEPATETITNRPAGADAAAPVLDEALARRLVEQARAEGTSLTGPAGRTGRAPLSPAHAVSAPR